MRDLRYPAVAMGAAVIVIAGLFVQRSLAPAPVVPSFNAQLCSLPTQWLERMQRGYFPARSAQVTVLPRTPAYMATGPGGWSHSGPWPYVQRIPLVFYEPGVVPAKSVSQPVTLADVAPTMGAMVGTRFRSHDGRVLNAVASAGHREQPPRLVVTVVWDGGGWDVLKHFPHSWPTLRRVMEGGTSFTHATVGSSPSVTPATHSTLGTGDYPWRSGITDIPVRDGHDGVADAFQNGASTSYLVKPTFADIWDKETGNRAKVGMVAYEPWHLGMLGHGAQWPGGDRDDAAWLDHETNDWITNDRYYRLPSAIVSEPVLDRYVTALDGRDGRVDGAWRDLHFLADRTHVEETPAFIDYQTWGLLRMIAAQDYGRDRVTDLLYTNYKQIDRNGHLYNMDSWEVKQSLRESDDQLGRLIHALNKEVGKRRWALVVTADHGQQPDASTVNGYAVLPRELKDDLNERFDGAVEAVWPTQVFLNKDVMQRDGFDAGDVARWLYHYRLEDNTSNRHYLDSGAGTFNPTARVFQAAVPSRALAAVDCSRSGGGGRS